MNSKILMAGYVGLQASAELVSNNYNELNKRLSKEYLDKLLRLREEVHNNYEGVKKELLGSVSQYVETTHIGAYDALWRLATGDDNKNHGVGISVELKKMPIRQETIEVTNLLDINPYNIPSEDVFVAFCDADDKLFLNNLKKGVPFEVIGGIIKGNRRIIKIGVDKETYLVPPRKGELD